MRSIYSLLAATVLVAVGVRPALAQTATLLPPPDSCRQAPVPVVPYPGCAQPQFVYPPGSPTQPDLGKSDQGPLGTQPSLADTQSSATPSPSADTGGGAGAGVGFSPTMFGDISGGPIVTTPVVISQGNLARPGQETTRQPLLYRGAFKIADNDSPRPTDRVFITYNYFDGINTYFNNLPNFNANRETIGFEKTFLSGNASVEMRLPFLQLNGGLGTDQQSNFVGDLTTILKYAVINDRQTGNVLCTGVAVTAPTGQSFLTVTGENIHDTLIQPYVGYIYNMNKFFVQGYTALVVPTSSQDITLFFNDVGIGYWLLRTNDSNRFLRGIVPTVEAHLITPLTHAGSQAVPVGLPDYLSLTGGVNFIFAKNSSLGFALGTPVTGPRPFNTETTVSLNIRF